jgi:hypothetical protein
VPARTQSYVDTTVGLYDVVTPAVRIGPWLGRGCAGLVVLGWLLALGQYRRSRRPRDEHEALAAVAAHDTSAASAVATDIDRTPA